MYILESIMVLARLTRSSLFVSLSIMSLLNLWQPRGYRPYRTTFQTGALFEQIKPPVIDYQRVPWRIFNLTFFYQRETKFATNRVRRHIHHRRKGVYELIFGCNARMFNHSRSSFGRDPLPLKGRQNQPTRFID